uniref:Glycos_transf_3 domain-containing protein n=1 Tax=Macrostomum lignano TaxID=282301 RepID=A0A1I8FLV1_9PLAT
HAIVGFSELLEKKLSESDGVVDKHSTGGVGDMVSPPMVHQTDRPRLKLPMISGRSLGHTGGTIDKMESIPGFNASLTAEQDCARRHVGRWWLHRRPDRGDGARRRACCTRQVGDATIRSILSKKAAEGISALVMDVKFGPAAFMTTFEEARIWPRANRRGYGMKVIFHHRDGAAARPLHRQRRSSGRSSAGAEMEGDAASAGCASLARQSGCLLRLTAKSQRTRRAAAVRNSWSDGSALKAMRRILVNQGVSERAGRQAVASGASSGVQEYLSRMGREPLSVTQLSSPAS